MVSPTCIDPVMVFRYIINTKTDIILRWNVITLVIIEDNSLFKQVYVSQPVYSPLGQILFFRQQQNQYSHGAHYISQSMIYSWLTGIGKEVRNSIHFSFLVKRKLDVILVCKNKKNNFVSVSYKNLYLLIHIWSLFLHRKYIKLVQIIQW